MKIEYNNFIGIYRNVYPDGYCQHVINEFDRLESIGFGYDRISSENSLKHRKDDFQIEATFFPINSFNEFGTTKMFFDGLQKCYEEYSKQYSSLKDVSITASNMKLQKTHPGGGYHIWHAEQGNGSFSSRSLVYLLYLNTLEKNSAGETEFLYQQKRIQPVENTLLIWPAAFTHTHRGNTVFGEKSKYVATGWFYFT